MVTRGTGNRDKKVGHKSGRSLKCDYFTVMHMGALKKKKKKKKTKKPEAYGVLREVDSWVS